VRLLEWLRRAPVDAEERITPAPVLRLKHLLGVLDRNAEHQARVAALLRRFWREIDSAALLADFASRRAWTCGASSGAASAPACCR